MKKIQLASATLDQFKDKHFEAQLRKVYDSFFLSPKTMKEVDKEIGIMRESICWYCKTLRKNNKLFKVGKRNCNITKHPNVTTWTTNPDLAPNQSKQITLF